ncbi:MAG: hypothetical protein COV44_06080 [Deltaproteobacteria bacterium CG11_big_fil_rev_8_21_14_0_20_45_16]|nr:MAG: hypothetical protein COV44_06080 [Deltaproteobacteria bacterium CG11_big_fil_rev_8_21_14_0_20_45_16]
MKPLILVLLNLVFLTSGSGFLESYVLNAADLQTLIQLGREDEVLVNSVSNAVRPPNFQSLTEHQNSEFLPDALQFSPEGLACSTSYQGPVHKFDLYMLDGPGSGTFTQPKIADLFLDGRKQIVSVLLSADMTRNCATLVPQGVYAWDSQGNLLPGFPVILDSVSFPYLCGYLSIVGIADVIGDYRPEIVVATGRNESADVNGGIIVLSNSGQILSEIRPDLGFSGGDSNHPVLVDLDHNGKSDILIPDYGWSNNHPDGGRRLYAFRGDGTPISGWPIQLNVGNRFLEPAVDAMGIVASVNPYDVRYGNRINSYDYFGNLQWSNDMGPNNMRPPMIGDLDGNGRRELIANSIVTVPPSYPYEMIIFDRKSGKEISRFRTQQAYTYSHDAALVNFFSASQQIVYQDSTRVFAANSNGTFLPGFPRDIWDTWNSPIPPYSYMTNLGVADLDGDGYPDIYGIALNSFRTATIGDHQYALFAFNRFGQSLRGFPFALKNYKAIPPSSSFGERYPPTYADLDNDGMADMITSKGWGAMEVVSLESPYNPKLACVPMYGVDSRNTKNVRSCIPQPGCIRPNLR